MWHILRHSCQMFFWNRLHHTPIFAFPDLVYLGSIWVLLPVNILRHNWNTEVLLADFYGEYRCVDGRGLYRGTSLAVYGSQPKHCSSSMRTSALVWRHQYLTCSLLSFLQSLVAPSPCSWQFHQRRLQQSEVCESWPKFGCRYLSYWERRAVALLNMYAWSCTYLSKIG